MVRKKGSSCRLHALLGAGICPRSSPKSKKAMCRDSKALELETAKEILAEVFRVRPSDVDEMILSRFEAAVNEDIGREELWPEEFSRE